METANSSHPAPQRATTADQGQRPRKTLFVCNMGRMHSRAAAELYVRDTEDWAD